MLKYNALKTRSIEHFCCWEYLISGALTKDKAVLDGHLAARLMPL